MNRHGFFRQSVTIKKQRGLALVETAITMSLFMVLVLGIFEVALLFFDWTRAVEATRVFNRYLVVNNALVNTDSLICDDASANQISFTCSDELCGVGLQRALAIAPMLTADNFEVSYRCSSASYANRPELMPVVSVQTRLVGFTGTLRVPSLVGFPATINMPGFETTRISEDLHTPETE